MKKYDRYIDQLFDEDNFDPIEVTGEDGKTYKLNQLAVVETEHGAYAVLVDENVEEGEAYVFFIDEEQDCLTYVDNELVANEVLAELDADYDEE
ncbi:MAG: hypothetical protein E7602_03680 [Ruminococcaceae bacterium]|nr:hypothetical protein [Oscillospiraceae bacterium]